MKSCSGNNNGVSFKYSSTFSRELVLSLLLSSRLFPESVETREPLESAWWTELMLGVELCGEAAGTKHKKLQIVCCMSEDGINHK